MRRFARIGSGLFLSLLIAMVTAWASLALWYRLPVQEPIRGIAAALFVLAGIVTIVATFTQLRLLTVVLFLAAFAAILLWWSTIRPESHGDWAPSVARQVTGKLDGDILTLTDLRDFDWRSDSDFSDRWITRTYDLSKVRTLDLFMSYWAGPEMAHTIMSFGFDGGDYIAWSIEVRRLKGGEYSPIADLFKTDPLVFIAADERDVIRVRTNIRHEDVELYRLKLSPEKVRSLLLEYVADANGLLDTPRFYNSLTTNCTTTIAKMARAVGDSVPFNWRLIANGYLPEYLYARGVVDTRMPLAELEKLAHIDKRGEAADGSPEFSELIRVGVPSPQHGPTP